MNTTVKNQHATRNSPRNRMCHVHILITLKKMIRKKMI